MLPMLALLTACVSYYQPESGLEDGVYYAEADTAYRYNADDFYYARAVVYPWTSIDTFYFGYWPYPSYSYDNWPYPIYGFNVVYPNEPGFAAGYYAFYSPWYWRGYSTFYAPVWRPYRENCQHHGNCGNPGGGVEVNALYSNNVKNKMGDGAYPRIKRYVSTTSAGQTGYQREMVQNYGSTKNGENRSKTNYHHSKGRATGRAMATVSDPGRRMPSPSDTFSGPAGNSSSFNTPSTSRSSSYGGASSRQKDRN